MQKGEYDVPKLRISSFCMCFTAEISKLDHNLFTDDPSDTKVEGNYMLEEEDLEEEDGSALCMSNEVTTTTTEMEQVDKTGEV